MGLIPTISFIAVLSLVFMFFAGYLCQFRKNVPLAEIYEKESSSATSLRRYPMERKDILPLVLITFVYSFTAFWGLGDTKAPESFCKFSDRGNYVILELKQPEIISRVSYYSGLHTGKYFMQFSENGVDYEEVSVMEQSYKDLFKWHDASLENKSNPPKYIRIISDSKLNMGELALYDWAGELLPLESIKFDAGAATLFDEQEKVPNLHTYMNSAYFDEIYHVRTAVENIEKVYPYEISHPPLGKLIIAGGIKAFGINPFGWRFSGVLFGILMLPFLYVFIKNLFGNTLISACGTIIFAFDFMHFTQTRIATIDTYGVFFILLMYFFMYRYITSHNKDGHKQGKYAVLNLFLSGFSFGLGIASKWTAVYGGAGLGLIWLIFRIRRGKEMCKAGYNKEHRSELIKNIAQCILFFVVIPAGIYYVSYYPYGQAKGMEGISMFFDKDYFKLFLDNQKYMFTYHSGVTAEHPYSSRWYQWIVDARPILYYLNSMPDNVKSAFGCFMNPALCWTGLLGIIAMAWRGIFKKDKKAEFIFIGYLAQLVPWMFITRITFEYHYFPCLIFLVLAVCHMFNTYRLRSKNFKPIIVGATALCLILFAAYYPVLTGVPVPRTYTDTLVWIPGSWPF